MFLEETFLNNQTGDMVNRYFLVALIVAIDAWILSKEDAGTCLSYLILLQINYQNLL